MAKLRKAVTPSILAIVTIVVDWIATGKLNLDSLKIAIAGLVTSMVVFFVPNAEVNSA